MPVINMKATGDNIKHLMKLQGMTPKDLQAIFGFDNVQTIYKWTGGKCLPNIDNIFILADVLHVKVDQLIVRDTVPVCTY